MKTVTNLIHVIACTFGLVFLHACSSNDDESSTAVKTFVDSGSGLEWASFWQAGMSVYLSYDEVMEYCETLNANGKNDWRMPNADETLDFLTRHAQLFDEFGNTTVRIPSTIDFSNRLSSQDNVSYSTSGPIDIVFREVPTIDYNNNSRYYGYTWLVPYDPHNPNSMPVDADLVPTSESTVVDTFLMNTIDEYAWQSHASYTCVRGTHSASRLPSGIWRNVENQIEIVGDGQYVNGLSIIDNRHIRMSTIMYQQWRTTDDGRTIPEGFVADRNAHYISSGIPDARFKGQLKSFAEASRIAPSALKSATGISASLGGIAGIDVILGCIRNNEPEHCQQFTVRPATPENPHNSFDQSTGDDIQNILYVTVDADGNYVLDNDNPITIATGEVTISLTDSAGNTAIFTVDIIGEDTNVGVLNIPDITTLYNFKSTMNHGADYIYYGYNDNETPVDYSKVLSICNTGTANISGTTFSIDVAPEHASLIRSFSHDYDGSPVGFTAGSCENYNVDFEFYRPNNDVEVRFNITVTDNFNSLAWEDYTTFRLSSHPPINLYFASNTQPLEGYLVAPGNQLVRVEFSENTFNDKFVRVPSFRDNEYSIVLSTSSVDGEDTYMISTMDSYDRNKMNGFSNVTAHEPNDNATDATVIPISYGEVVSYLHSGDLDYFTLKDAPEVFHKVNTMYPDEDIVIPFNTSLDPLSVIDSVSVNQNGSAVAGTTVFESSRNAIVFNPDSSINPGTIKITLNDTIKSESGVAIGGDSIWDTDVNQYPQTMTAVSRLSTTGFVGLLEDYLITYRVKETGSGTYAAIYDHINKQVPLLIGESSISKPFTASDGHCFTNEYDTAIRYTRPTLYDCSDVRNIRKLLVYPLSIANASSTGFTVSGNRLYVVYQYSGKYGLDLIDITDPLQPTILGSITSDTTGTSEVWGSNITVKNDRLYLNWTWRLHVFDISNESSPAFLQEIHNPSYFNTLEGSPDGSILYTPNYSTGKLTVVDITNPSAPVYNETLPGMPSGVKTLTVSGTKLYIVTDQHVMQVIDITTPTAPAVLGSYRYSSSTSIFNGEQVMINGNFAYIYDRADGEIEIVNIQMYQ